MVSALKDWLFLFLSEHQSFDKGIILRIYYTVERITVDYIRELRESPLTVCKISGLCHICSESMHQFAYMYTSTTQQDGWMLNTCSGRGSINHRSPGC